MKLTTLLQSIKVEKIYGSPELEISGLVCDSRCVTADCLFFALPGTHTDGFDFIPQALASGAAAVICERIPDNFSAEVCFIRVANVRQVMAQLASHYNGCPTANVPVIGITGTNGKTTITYLLEAVLRQAGYSPAVFGTVEYRFGNERLASIHTTPESLQLMQLMGQFRRQGADAFILEVSSHALEQHRVDGIEFDVAVFTNLTPEHLDYHQNLDNYFSSKKRLFNELLGQGQAAINQDDEFGQRLLRENPDWSSFGTGSTGRIHPLTVSVARQGITGSFASPTGNISIDSSMIGHFNVSNLLATVAAAQLLGIDNDLIAAGITAAPQVPGRLQRVPNDRDVLALVDYAHSSDALEQVLATLSKLDARRLLTLVGCGGDRDPGKRPVMAAAAVKYSDLVILTSDNPRTEDPLAILEPMRTGALSAGAAELNVHQIKSGEKGFVVIPDRREAIRLAGSLAEAGDLLLLAGKGHETYQILGTTKVHFDDREELSMVFNRNADNFGSEAGDDV